MMTDELKPEVGNIYIRTGLGNLENDSNFILGKKIRIKKITEKNVSFEYLEDDGSIDTQISMPYSSLLSFRYFHSIFSFSDKATPFQVDDIEKIIERIGIEDENK